MDLVKIIILAAIQGFTEFLPISSSGHLVLFQDIFNIDQPGLTLEIFLHAGTLLSVVAVYYKDILKLIKAFFTSLNFKNKVKTDYEKLVWLIILANIPAGLAGFLLKSKIEIFFTSSLWVFFFLIVTGGVLYLNRFFYKKEGAKLESMTSIKSVLIGLSQMVAILPGISRSGMTITTGIILKINKEDAARFSFLIMLPAVAGAIFLEFIDMDRAGFNYFNIIIGIAVSFLTGYIAIKSLLKLIKICKIHYFSYYCILIGLLGLVHYIILPRP